jgi:hypothetical protein
MTFRDPALTESPSATAERVWDQLDAAVWQRKAEAQIVELIGPEEWALGQRRRKKASCYTLARAARRLLELDDQLRDLAAESVEKVLDQVQMPRLPRKLAGALVRRAPIPPMTHLQTAARAIRLLGVLTCLVQDIAASQCICLMDLVKEVAGVGVEKILDDAFAGLTVKGDA